MKLGRLVTRTAAVVLPAALVVGSGSAAFAAPKPAAAVPVLSTKPAAVTNATGATFAWAPATGTSYKCSLDGAAAVVCTSPKAYSGLASKAHSFKVTASATGKRSSSTSYSWTVDTTAPVAPGVTRTAPASSPAASSTASFSLTDAATDLAGYRCSLDGAAFGTCTTPLALSGLTTGSHQVVVKAVDKAGNLSAGTGSAAWLVDVTPPTLPGLVGPGRTKVAQPSVSITPSADTTTLLCSLDGAAATNCTSGTWTAGSVLADGDHTLSVVAADALGNAAAPADVVFTVDTTGPAKATLVSGPPSLTSATSALVAFADVEPTATFTCSFNGGAYTACTSPFSASALTDGAKTLDVLAADALGNAASSALHVAWTVDSAAPTTAVFLTTPKAYTNATSAAFSWARSDETTTGFRCSFDGGAYGDCDAANPGETATSTTLTGLVDGTYTFAVETRDAANNWSVPATFQWVVDTSAPTAVPHSNGVPTGNQGSVSSTPTFAFGSTDPSVGGFLCQLDGGAWLPCSSGYVPTGLADGTHTLKINTVDQAGNPGTGAPLVYTWTLDTHAPVGTIAFPTALASPVTVRFAEPVLGVTTSSARLLLAGTTSVVATSLRCLEASGNTVPCSLASGVRAIVLQPTARLVPGQKYRLAVTGVVHDLAGNPAVVSTATYRALRVLQESELAVGQVWAAKSSTSAYGGTFVQARLAGASLTYPFTGTTITWFTATGPAMGTARVYCGSILKATVNNYASTAHWKVARSVRCSSSSARNVLKIVATGAKGSSDGTGTQVVVDAVKVGTVLTSSPVLVQRWAVAASSLASGGRYAVADQTNEAVALTFRGTSITWRALLGRSMGKAKVYVDGVYKGTFDQYASSTKAANRVWKLTDKVHTIRIVATGTRRSGATGTRVVLDSLTVG